MKDILSLLKKIQNERFVHNISELTYDRLFTLWHLNPRIQRQLSGVVSRAVIGLFILRYLTHVHEEVMKELGIGDRLTSKDLSNKKKIEKIVKKLNKNNRFISLLEKDILPQLIDIMENTKAKNLEDLCKLAHSGDYLSLVLEDLKAIEDPEYLLWLESIPEYYDRDLTHMSLKKRPVSITKGNTRSLALEKWITNLNKHTPSTDAAYANGKTFSVRPHVKERRRPLVGFNRWVRETTTLVNST